MKSYQNALGSRFCSLRRWGIATLFTGVLPCLGFAAQPGTLDAKAIGQASGTEATATTDGVVRIGWARTDVVVTVDGMRLPPAAGLGSWAAFAPMGPDAMVMGDTVVFEDEVDAAMDAAFAHGLSVTALHNHFFHDTPKVYFMHIAGQGSPDHLATDVKAVWDAIRAVRSANSQPAGSFGGATPTSGHVTPGLLAKIVGQPATDAQGVAKVTIGRKGTMGGTAIGGSMGLTTWAAFSGNDTLAAMDGDFMMTAGEVQPVLRALRRGGVHVVALHSHMIGEQPDFYFTHFWGTGSVQSLAQAFRAALDAQASARQH